MINMKKLLSFLLITVFVLVLTACGGGGGGGGGISSSPSAGSPAGSTVSYSPAYTYNVPADKTSSDAYLIRRSVSVGILPTPGATSYASVASIDSEPELQFAARRFPQNTDEWPVPKAGVVTRNRALASIQSKNYVVYGSVDDNDEHTNSTENFWVLTNFADGSGITKKFRLKKVGTHCRVWYCEDEDNSNGALTDTQLGNIQTKLDAMFEVETALCGSMVPAPNNWSNIISINSNTKLEIVIYEMEHSLCGYFSPNDFTTNGVNSNQAPIIYVSSYNFSPETYSTISHEFDHLLNYVNKTVNHYLSMQTWYTELLSNTIEEVLEKFNFDENDPGDDSVRKWLQYFLISYNYGLKWNQDSASYANVYAFGAWLVRNYGGAQLFKEIATNPYVNEESIVRAVNTVNSGANETFASLRKKFAESLIYTTESGKPNFNKAVTETFAGKSIVMPAIDLNSIPICYTSAALANILASRIPQNANYYVGPVLFNPEYHFSDLPNIDPFNNNNKPVLDYGFEIQKLGSGLTQIQIPSNQYGTFEVVFK